MFDDVEHVAKERPADVGAPAKSVTMSVALAGAAGAAAQDAVAVPAVQVNAQALSGADTGKSQDKIDIDSLPSVPAVFHCAHFGQFMPKDIEETLHDKANATASKGALLDLADEQMLEQAQTVRTRMFGDPTGVERDLARALHVNDSATFGCLPEGNTTEGHFHVMGVLNYMIGERGDDSGKNWSFYELKYPRIEAARKAVAVKPLTQHPGDLIYIPPGWGHEVYTYRGTNKGTRRQHNKYTSHFVSWIMPRDYIGTEQGFAHLAHFMSGRRIEKQTKSGKKVNWGNCKGSRQRCEHPQSPRGALDDKPKVDETTFGRFYSL